VLLRGMAEQDYGKHDPRNHARDCTFHLDQYAFECDCGATARYGRKIMDRLHKRKKASEG